MGQNNDILLDVKGLKKYFPIKKGFFNAKVGDVRAVNDVGFTMMKGENFGLVGESGCGKTTTGRCILRAIESTAGSVTIHLDGKAIDVNALDKKQLKEARKNMQMIFQDPYASLNPRMIIKDIIAEPLVCNNACPPHDISDRVADLLTKVGLNPDMMSKYPHAFSGGQRQRIGIARSLALNPHFVVCDEPVSALDVSVQAQVLNLLRDLQDEFKLSYLFISHDLGVVRHICNTVAVMYVGKIVEVGETEDIYAKPRHPYTEALLASIPYPDPAIKYDRYVLSDEVADPSNPPPGCSFHPRCRYCEDICKKNVPAPYKIAAPGGREHLVYCHLAEKLSLRGTAGLE
jgi:peptide/nickel transport system ATP-binding protein